MRRNLSALLLISLAACGPTSDHPNATVIFVKGPMGSSVTLKNLNKSDGEVDDIPFQIRDGQFQSRGKNHGLVKLGDQVAIESNGVVRVNGSVREPLASP
jgi:hypothetical protein